jgi:hypothetical protein
MVVLPGLGPKLLELMEMSATHFRHHNNGTSSMALVIYTCKPPQHTYINCIGIYTWGHRSIYNTHIMALSLIHAAQQDPTFYIFNELLRNVQWIIHIKYNTWTSSDGKMHIQIGLILIDRRQHSSILDVWSFRAADCDTDNYLVVAKVRERLAMCKQTIQTQN